MSAVYFLWSSIIQGEYKTESGLIPELAHCVEDQQSSNHHGTCQGNV